MKPHHLQLPTTPSTLLLTLLCLPILWACQSTPSEPAKDYNLVEEDGIFVEQFDSTNVGKPRGEISLQVQSCLSLEFNAHRGGRAV